MRWASRHSPLPATARRLGTLAAALLVLAALLVASLPPTGPGPAGPEGPVPCTDAVLTVTERSEVSGVQTYDRIRVESTGTLVIPSGASLLATVMTMEGDARLEMTGGTLLLRGGPVGEAPSLTGSCQYLDMTDGSTISVQGRKGTTDADGSAGTSALLSVSARTHITVFDSTLEVLGGAGLSPHQPLDQAGVVGDHCSGGNATLSLTAQGHEAVVNVRSSTIKVIAGDGGDAPDGVAGGRGGGYSDGGEVGGRVGAGGSAWFNLTSDEVLLDGSTVTVTAGGGGDAGDGARVAEGHEHGGGGGGYSGGAGALELDGVAGPGGWVHGDVGSGGDAWLLVQGINYQQTGTTILVEAGAGGAAGRGGDSMGRAGGGGGGYSGGGGGSSDEPEGAAGGALADDVASGGRSYATLLLDLDVRVEGSTIEVLAGEGGDAGDGGLSLGMAGGGGGGFSGGGGSGSSGTAGVSGRSMSGGAGGSVTDRVATGGEARLRVNSSTGYMEANDITVSGGDGGRGGRAGRTWQDPDTDVWLGGGGGGAYSAGGGGGYSEYSQDPRSGGQASPVWRRVGDGGDGSLRIEIITPTIHAENRIACSRGQKGVCWRSTAAGDTGGEGAGRFTRDGRAHTHVPIGRTELLGPPDGLESRAIPVFSWKPLYPSTTNGFVEEYSIEVAYHPSFDKPIHHTMWSNTSYNFTSLRKGQLYWRVTPIYSRPHMWAGIPSEAFEYHHLNAPPEVDEVPLKNLTVRVPGAVDLHPYVRDVDDDIEDLWLSVDSPDVNGVYGLVVSLKYDSYKPPHDVYFNVTDGFDTTEGCIPVRILDDNHDPAIMGLGEYDRPVNISIKEGFTIGPLKLRYYDQDGDELRIHLITSWDGIYQVENDTIFIKAEEGDVGKYEPVIIVEDDRGGRSEMRIVIRVGNVGAPPSPPVFLNPADGSRYDKGDAVVFRIGIKDPDLAFGDTVNLTVISNVSGVLWFTQADGDVTFTTTDLGPGHHLVTAVVVDGEFQERANITLVVVGDPEPSNVWDPPDELWLLLGLLAAALGVMAVSYWVGYRRRKARARG